MFQGFFLNISSLHVETRKLRKKYEWNNKKNFSLCLKRYFRKISDGKQNRFLRFKATLNHFGRIEPFPKLFYKALSLKKVHFWRILMDLSSFCFFKKMSFLKEKNFSYDFFSHRNNWQNLPSLWTVIFFSSEYEFTVRKLIFKDSGFMYAFRTVFFFRAG